MLKTENDKEKIIVEITRHDIMNVAQHPLGAEQTMLSLLQEKGAPISGVIYYELSPGYNVTRHSDKLNDLEVFIFEKVTNEQKLQKEPIRKRWFWF